MFFCHSMLLHLRCWVYDYFCRKEHKSFVSLRMRCLLCKYFAWWTIGCAGGSLLMYAQTNEHHLHSYVLLFLCLNKKNYHVMLPCRHSWPGPGIWCSWTVGCILNYRSLLCCHLDKVPGPGQGWRCRGAMYIFVVHLIVFKTDRPKLLLLFADVRKSYEYCICIGVILYWYKQVGRWTSDNITYEKQCSKN